MKTLLDQMEETKKLTNDTADRARKTIHKALGEQYFISIHYHYSNLVISVWDTSTPAHFAPSYYLLDDGIKEHMNTQNEQPGIREKLHKIFYEDCDAQV